MAEKSIKVNPEIHKQVDEHTQKIGGKIGKFYDIAAKEKLERENKVEWPLRIETKDLSKIAGFIKVTKEML